VNFLSLFGYISGIKLEDVRVAWFLPIRTDYGFVVVLDVVLAE